MHTEFQTRPLRLVAIPFFTLSQTASRDAISVILIFRNNDPAAYFLSFSAAVHNGVKTEAADGKNCLMRQTGKEKGDVSVLSIPASYLKSIVNLELVI